MFPGCVISMYSYDFIKYHPQPATKRSKVQKQGYNKEDKEILQDRQTDRQTDAHKEPICSQMSYTD